MRLNALAEEYRISGEACRERAAMLERQLRCQLKEGTLGALETMRARRRITTLRSMARDCAATACYLEHYYDRGMSFERYI